MLDELFDFEGVSKEIPKITIKKASYKQSTKNKLKYDILSISKDEAIQNNKSSNSPQTLGEKILKRQKNEEEKMKKAEIYKELHQNKKINLHHFLSRVQNFEQKRKYNLELKKYKQLQRETESMQEKPKLSSKTLKICQTMPKKPLYKRTNEVMEEHKKEIKNLTSFYTLPREIIEKTLIDKNNTHNNKITSNSNISKKLKAKYYSVGNTRSSNYNYYNNSLQTYENSDTTNKINNSKKKMTKQLSDEFFEKQEKWLKNKRLRNQYFEKYTQIQNDTYSDITFKPYISQATLEILDIKNRINTYNDEFYKYNIPNSYSRYNNFIINKGRTIWDKLYEEAFQKKICLGELNIWENINNNKMRKKKKFRNVSSKIFDKYLKKDKDGMKKKKLINKSFDNKKNISKKTKQKIINNSFDNKLIQGNIMNTNKNMNSSVGNLRKKEEYKRKSFLMFNDEEEYNFYKMKKEKEKFHWRNSLLNIKPIFSEPNDSTYHLNIMQVGAWNDNYLNRITLNENSKCKSVINLVNLYK